MLLRLRILLVLLTSPDEIFNGFITWARRDEHVGDYPQLQPLALEAAAYVAAVAERDAHQNDPVWLSSGTAHDPGRLPRVEVWAQEPHEDPATGVMAGPLLASLCASGIDRSLALRIKSGAAPRKFRLTAEELLPILVPAIVEGILTGPPVHVARPAAPEVDPGRPE